MTSSNGNIFRVTGPSCGEFNGHQWGPARRSFDVFLDLRLNKRCENSSEAGDLRRHRAHYDFTVIFKKKAQDLIYVNSSSSSSLSSSSSSSSSLSSSSLSSSPSLDIWSVFQREGAACAMQCLPRLYRRYWWVMRRCLLPDRKGLLMFLIGDSSDGKYDWAVPCWALLARSRIS